MALGNLAQSLFINYIIFIPAKQVFKKIFKPIFTALYMRRIFLNGPDLFITDIFKNTVKIIYMRRELVYNKIVK